MNGERANTINRRRLKRLGFALTAAVAGVGLAAVAVTAAPLRTAGQKRAETSTREFTFPMAPPGVLRILNAGGRVIVRAWDRQEVLLTITQEAVRRGGPSPWLPFVPGRAVDAATQAALDPIEPVVSQRDGGLEVSTVERGRSDDLVINYHYEVRMPRASALAVNNGAGPVTVSGVEGGVEVVSGNGDIRFDSVGGVVSAQAENGALNLTRVRGPLDAHTANGAIIVDNRAVGALHPVRCRTENGPIRFRVPHEADYAVRATTQNGRVNAEPADAGSVEAILHTLNGSIDVDGV